MDQHKETQHEEDSILQMETHGTNQSWTWNTEVVEARKEKNAVGWEKAEKLTLNLG